jgi:alpha-tubulin suppressor-like RCC1 family protein
VRSYFFLIGRHLKNPTCKVIIIMASILLANLLLLLSYSDVATAIIATDHDTQHQGGLRNLQQTTNSNSAESYLPGDDSMKSWLFGAGDSSEWGVTPNTTTTTMVNHHRPTLINIPSLRQDEYVTDTSAGTLHSTVVTNQGRILTAGSTASQDSGIGRDTFNGAQLNFQPIAEVYYAKNLESFGDGMGHNSNPSTPPSFTKVVASQYYTVALDTNGNVWSTGRNNHGQLCLGDTTARDRFHQIPTMYMTEKKVVDIALGERHTLLLMDDGRVLGCGWNAYGQLGIGLKGEDMLGMVEIVIDEPDFDNSTETPINHTDITQIAAGRGSSYFLTSSDHVYATGSNYEGQLCLGDRVDRPLPTMIQPVEDMLSNPENDFSLNDEGVDIQLIAAGKLSFYMLFSNGQVVACGKNTHGQLGNGNISSNNSSVTTTSPEESSDVPTIVTALTNVTDIFAAAISFTVFFLQSNGIYGVGSDGSGQLGWEGMMEVSFPGNETSSSAGNNNNIIISSGNDHTLFLVNAHGIFDCEGGSSNTTNTSLAPTMASMAPSISASTPMDYPTPSPSPFQPQSPTKSPVKNQKNDPTSGGSKANVMGVFWSGVAFAAWRMMM